MKFWFFMRLDAAIIHRFTWRSIFWIAVDRRCGTKLTVRTWVVSCICIAENQKRAGLFSTLVIRNGHLKLFKNLYEKTKFWAYILARDLGITLWCVVIWWSSKSVIAWPAVGFSVTECIFSMLGLIKRRVKFTFLHTVLAALVDNLMSFWEDV